MEIIRIVLEIKGSLIACFLFLQLGYLNREKYSDAFIIFVGRMDYGPFMYINKY